MIHIIIIYYICYYCDCPAGHKKMSNVLKYCFHPVLLDLKRENAMLLAKLDCYQRIKAKDRGITYFQKCINTNFCLICQHKLHNN